MEENQHQNFKRDIIGRKVCGKMELDKSIWSKSFEIYVSFHSATHFPGLLEDVSPVQIPMLFAPASHNL